VKKDNNSNNGGGILQNLNNTLIILDYSESGNGASNANNNGVSGESSRA
jgi:hypothetical protein